MFRLETLFVGFWKGLQNLQNKCFVKVDSENDMHMHDHVKDLGRNIAKISS